MTSHTSRIRIVLGGIIVVALFFSVRLYNLQIAHGAYYTEEADHQYVTPAGNVFDRGSIFFTKRDGELVSAASLASGYKVAIIPEDIAEPEELYEQLNQVLDLDHETFIDRANREDDPYEEIAHHINQETADALRQLDLDTVRIYKEKWRTYPATTSAAHTIGFVGFQDDEYAGRYGLERQYEYILDRSTNERSVNFFAEIFTDIQDLFADEDQSHEGDIVTTIEPSVQVFLDRELADIQDTWSSAETGGIIINPQTGAIYGIGAMPSYDPNTYQNVSSIGEFRNPLVENLYEMGSIIKPIVMSIGLETGAVTAEETYYDSGSVTITNHTIWNFDKKGRGTASMQDVLNQSLNTGMVYAGEQIGKDDFYAYLKKFKLGGPTEVDLPNEATGLMSNLETKRDLEFANISFGQGIALTPIATVRALSALGNGGYMTQPHIAQKILHTNGSEEILTYPSGEQVISSDTSDEISRMLTVVVDEALYGGSLSLERYSIAAKTGTAQIPNPEAGGYYSDRNLHSFFGYVPAYDPKFLVYLYTKHPKNVKYASQTLTEPFMNIIKFLITYYEIPPDR